MAVSGVMAYRIRRSRTYRVSRWRSEAVSEPNPRPIAARGEGQATGLRPLSGIKVIDFTRYLAGPFCTQTLGDYGAEVIKIEPVEGARAEMGGYAGKDSYFFMCTNRSKKSVQIATRTAEGRAVAQRLIDAADIVVDNFRPGVMEAMGFDYDRLAVRNPRIIACSVSGFGPNGPLRDNPGFDQIAQGFSGLMSVT